MATKRNFSAWDIEEDQGSWTFILSTENYNFFGCLDECDENGNTRMYDTKMKLVSDNYFANVGLHDEVDKIVRGETRVYYIHPEIMYLLHEKESTN